LNFDQKIWKERIMICELRSLQRTLIKVTLNICLLNLTACMGQQQGPDLAILYNESASYHSPDRNPIIVIPGILGSRLMYTPKGTVAWGAFESGAADPSNPDGARIIALPIGREDKLNQMHDEVKPTGVLERLRINLGGISLNIQAYAGILRTLGAGGYRDEALGMSGEIDYGDNHYTCFQFAYDWRRDNVENARLLHDFIKEKQEYVRHHYKQRFGIDKKDIKFDIVAHSMGGLITRYFLMYGTQDLPADGSLPELNWNGAEFVERVILVGTPNSGSANTFLHLVQGEQLAPLLPYYPPALLGTFPSVYQLLPRPRHKAVVWDGNHQQPVDFLDPKVWERMGWGVLSPKQQPMLKVLMPEVRDESERKKQAQHYLRLVLARAKSFQQALDRPAKTPDGLSLFLVGGDAADTIRTISINSRDGTHEILKTGFGDETVLRASALADERMTGDWKPRIQSPIDFQTIFFLPYDHLELTQNAIFRDNVLFWLLEDAR
jgi:pimeloyl-ACP methyl ester carboxylesterase